MTGVLQRIAVVFLACSLLFLNANWKTMVKIGAITLMAYWVIMAFVPVPGIGVASLEPGRNIAAWIDSYLLPGRMWQGSWDPGRTVQHAPLDCNRYNRYTGWHNNRW